MSFTKVTLFTCDGCADNEYGDPESEWPNAMPKGWVNVRLRRKGVTTQADLCTLCGSVIDSVLEGDASKILEFLNIPESWNEDTEKVDSKK